MDFVRKGHKSASELTRARILLLENQELVSTVDVIKMYEVLCKHIGEKPSNRQPFLSE
jgi:hypothetical protein